MATLEEHEILTRVGAGTPLGELFRQYQIPVLLSAELYRGGPPKRVRLLGEDLIAFRTAEGKVGLVGEYCSHRLASLYFGRIEEEGSHQQLLASKGRYYELYAQQSFQEVLKNPVA